MLRNCCFRCWLTLGIAVATSVLWLLSSLAMVAFGEEKERVWTDSTGKHKITATFVSQVGDEVELKRSDGKTIKMPLAKLSEKDRSYLANSATSANRSDRSESASVEGGLRVWMDSTGAHRIKATFEGREGANVKLRREDGKLIIMQIAKLSDSDQEYLKDLNGAESFDRNKVGDLKRWQTAASQAEADELARYREQKEGNVSAQPRRQATIAKVREDSGDFEIKGKTMTLEQNGQEFYLGSFGRAKRLNAVNSPRTWKVQPAKLVATPTGDFQNVMIDSKASLRLSGLVYTTDSIFYVGYRSDKNMDGIARLDATAGTCEIATFSSESNFLYDVTRNGKYALSNIKLHSEDPFLRDAFLAITDVSSFTNGDLIDPQAIFCPYYKPQKNQNINPAVGPNLKLHHAFVQIEDAFIVDSGHIFTKCESEATLWDLRTCNAIYSIRCQKHSLVVDPTHTFFVLADNYGMGFYDIDTGEALGYVRISANGSCSPSRSNFAFSPNGEKLACLSSQSVHIIDLTKGKIENTFVRSEEFEGVTWATNEYLLVGRFCYDVETGVPVAYYSNLSEANNLICLDDNVWTITSSTLVALKLPHEEAVVATRGKTFADLYDVYPGIGVSIKCELNNLVDVNEATDLIKNRIATCGLKYDPQASAVIVATARDTGRTEEAQITEVEVEHVRLPGLPGLPRHSIPRSSFPSGEKVVSENIVTLKIFEQAVALRVNGKDVFVDRGETVGKIDAERDESKTVKEQVLELNKPAVGFYDCPGLPPFASKLNGKEAVTYGRITTSGVE